MIARQIVRRFGTSAIRRSDHGPDSGNRAGSNLPFDINNKYKLTAYFCAFVGSAFALPFLMVRYQLLK